MTKIITVDGEMNASIIKGLLASNDIVSSVGPGEGSLDINPKVNRGPNVPYDVLVHENDMEKARKILQEASFLK